GASRLYRLRGSRFPSSVATVLSTRAALGRREAGPPRPGDGGCRLMPAAGRSSVWGKVVALLALALYATPLSAQYFGQNHVQYDRLRWRVIETEHFLVHYYPEISDVAPEAARMAERSYARLSRLMQHQFREKKP